MISNVFSNLVNCVILWFCNMEVIRQDHIVLYGTWKFSLQFVRPHPTDLCEIMRILAVWHIYKNTFSTWQIKYCKNCVFKLSECSCEVFLSLLKMLPLDICIWDHRICQVGRSFMRSSCSKVSWGQSGFFRALSNLVLKTPNMIISCIPKIPCN